MVALDARDGSLVWQAGDDAASYTPAYPIMFQGRQLTLGYLQNALVCHDLASVRHHTQKVVQIKSSGCVFGPSKELIRPQPHMQVA